ncbi:OmpA family protein [Arenicella sp. 4NH20-0111]|uniref:OmpA family protein n=1 Tax=Arenicella sp. 4NH20-0111 TaxID=3127648 RepID=UPI003341B809
MNRKIGLMLTILMSLILTACASKNNEQVTDPEPTTTPVAEVDPNANNAFGSGLSMDQLRALGITGDPRDEKVVYFEYNSTAIDRRSQVILGAHARYLGQNAGTRVSLEGHADERGTRDYNLALGERRANVVSDFLNSANAGSNNQTISYGEERPVDTAHTESAWQRNRRVEVKY